MSDTFFEQAIINSPYERPARHWQLDEAGLPTQTIITGRRKARFTTPIPQTRQQDTAPQDLLNESGAQQYDKHNSIINELRARVDQWRRLPNARDWQVTPITARLLRHWRHYAFHSIRPFFCQVEAVEVVIWLTEVAPQAGKRERKFIDYLHRVNAAVVNDSGWGDAGQSAAGSHDAVPPVLPRLALKLATGAGKTTIMAMLIAWQALNALRSPMSHKFTHGFLIVAPGLTIKDRLRVLNPNDPDSYYKDRELIPDDMLGAMHKARIVITNYHAFKRRERIQASKGNRALLQGHGADIATLETQGQMLQRVMHQLMHIKNIMVLNDEAHHCYCKKPGNSEEGQLSGEERAEAKANSEAARLWISGLEAVARTLGIGRVVDLSATPFFLRGSGYREGALFPWTMSDFSLMDAIECGIVKLPRVPVADNIPSDDSPMYRNLWQHISAKMPRKGRAKAGPLDPLSIPPALQTALDALYGHYAKTFALWQERQIAAPPCFIVICNNTASSKLVYDYIAGFYRQREDGAAIFHNGKFELFRNFDDNGKPYHKPRTLLIDSRQLEAGDALDKDFRAVAADEIQRFKRERKERGEHGELSDAELLREVMNTVGKPGKLGGSIHCVVSVSMLTEGWDANTVTHILGVRAFGTQLLCEQVVGRALRRQSYALNEAGLFDVEYADVFGIPFDFTAQAVVVPPQPPPDTVRVEAVRPARDKLEVRFPRVIGYRTELPAEQLSAAFTDDHQFELTPALVGATETRSEGIIGAGVDMNLVHTNSLRRGALLYYLTVRLLDTQYRDPDGEPKLYLFGQLKRITRRWLEECLLCKGGTYPAQLMYQALADAACEKIAAAIMQAEQEKHHPIKAMLDPYNPTGSTAHVNFTTSKRLRWRTDARRCHLNWIICDKHWESEFCRVAEAHERTLAYVKNYGLGLEVPYRYQGEAHRYLPDFIVQLDDGHGAADPLKLIVEIKGQRDDKDKAKRLAIETYWIPGVNNLKTYGRWAFAEFTDVFDMQQGFEDKVEDAFNDMMRAVIL